MPITIPATDGDDAITVALPTYDDTFELDAGAGNDRITANGYGGHVSAGSGDDIVSGRFYPLSVEGGAGDDILIADAYIPSPGGPLALGPHRYDGGDGNDWLDVGSNNQGDYLGGAGDDAFTIGALPVGQQTCDGGTGFDLAYRAYGEVQPLAISLATGVGTGAASHQTLLGFEALISSDGDDALAGSSGHNLLMGMGGADSLQGGAGNDLLAGHGPAGVSPVSRDFRTEVLDLVATGKTAGLLAAAAAYAPDDAAGAADVLMGEGGDDVLRGDGGGDTLDGGAGSDWASYAGSGFTWITDATTGATVARGVEVGLTGGLAAFGHAQGDVLVSIENLFGSLYADLLGGDGGANALSGWEGDDSLSGGGGADWLDGGLGNDRLDGGTGTDVLVGGAGDDTYVTDGGDRITERAAEGTDRVLSPASHSLGAQVENLTLIGSSAVNGTGNGLANVIRGNGAANTLDGGAGADTLLGGKGDDTYVTDGADTIGEDATGGLDTVRSSVSLALGANLENLVLTGPGAIHGTGNGLDNSLVGTSGANSLVGGGGADVLLGKGGGDSLTGSAGRDALYGGADRVRDSFVFAAAADSAVGAGRDVVHDFVSGIDLIDLERIDADTRVAGDQDFTLGTGPRAHAVWWSKAGADLLVCGDVNGDRAADFEIRVTGLGALALGDFDL